MRRSGQQALDAPLVKRCNYAEVKSAEPIVCATDCGDDSKCGLTSAAFQH